MNEGLHRVRKVLAGYQPKKIKTSDRIPAAVIMPLVQRDGELVVVFTRRTTHVRHHQGEICFPGGAVNFPEELLVQGALRELQEELAVPSEKVKILGELDQIKTVSSYFVVTPYIGLLEEDVIYQPNPTEVEEVFEAPLHLLQEPSIFRIEERWIDGVSVPVYFYQWRSYTIWGVTARILKNLLDLLENPDQRS